MCHFNTINIFLCREKKHFREIRSLFSNRRLSSYFKSEVAPFLFKYRSDFNSGTFAFRNAIRHTLIPLSLSLSLSLLPLSYSLTLIQSLIHCDAFERKRAIYIYTLIRSFSHKKVASRTIIKNKNARNTF